MRMPPGILIGADVSAVSFVFYAAQKRAQLRLFFPSVRAAGAVGISR